MVQHAGKLWHHSGPFGLPFTAHHPDNIRKTRETEYTIPMFLSQVIPEVQRQQPASSVVQQETFC